MTINTDIRGSKTPVLNIIKNRFIKKTLQLSDEQLDMLIKDTRDTFNLTILCRGIKHQGFIVNNDSIFTFKVGGQSVYDVLIYNAADRETVYFILNRYQIMFGEVKVFTDPFNEVSGDK